MDAFTGDVYILIKSSSPDSRECASLLHADRRSKGESQGEGCDAQQIVQRLEALSGLRGGERTGSKEIVGPTMGQTTITQLKGERK